MKGNHMKYLILSLIMLLTVPIAASASSNQIMLEMIDFITERSDYEYQGQPLPWIEIRTQDELCRAVYTPESYAKLTSCDVVGYYDNNLNTVFVSDDPGQYMVEEGFFETVLVHELVHYLQYLNGYDKKVACMAEMEKDAYRLHAEYVDYRGYPQQQKPNALFAIFASMCDKWDY
jgi:hypothetical protein